MVRVILDPYFRKIFSKVKDETLKSRIIKQIKKLKNNPRLGKPMRYSRKGTRELYMSPFRLSYAIKGDTIYLLDLYHKDEQ